MKTIFRAISRLLLFGFAKIVKRFSRLRSRWQRERCEITFRSKQPRFKKDGAQSRIKRGFDPKSDYQL